MFACSSTVKIIGVLVKNFDPFMKKSWLILVISGVMISVLPSTTSYSVAFLLISSVWLAIYVAFVIFSLNQLATEDGLLKTKKPITIWGYIWRSIIVYWASFMLAMIPALMIIGAQPHPPSPSIPAFLFISAFQALFSIVVIWIFFSKDRKSQIRWLLSLGRGY